MLFLAQLYEDDEALISHTTAHCNCRKSPLLNKLLGDLILNCAVTTDGVRSQATWQGNPNIAKWGLTWQEMDDGYIEIGCSIFMKGVMLPGHNNILEVLAVDNDVNILICLHPLRGAEGDSQSDYIAVRLPWKRYNEVICGEKAIGIWMVFDNGEFPEFEDEMMGYWAQMTFVRLARNMEIGAKKTKVTKKKASVPSSAGGGEAENSVPKKSKDKPKEADDVVLDIDKALRCGDKASGYQEDLSCLRDGAGGLLPL